MSHFTLLGRKNLDEGASVQHILQDILAVMMHWVKALKLWLIQQNCKQNADLIVGHQGNSEDAEHNFYSANVTENFSSKIFASTKSFFK